MFQLSGSYFSRFNNGLSQLAVHADLAGTIQMTVQRIRCWLTRPRFLNHYRTLVRGVSERQVSRGRRGTLVVACRSRFRFMAKVHGYVLPFPSSLLYSSFLSA